jgi:DNA replication protein DnaC
MSEGRRGVGPPDFERMNLPEEFWRAKIQETPESVRDVVHSYLFRIKDLVQKGAGLYLYGPVGVGKTGIASLVAKEARARSFTVFFIGVWELREAVKVKMQFDESASVLDRCRSVDVLILDNLREEDEKEYMVNGRMLEELISYRKLKKRVTVITSKMTPMDLRGKMPGLYDATVGSLVPISVVGDNRRVRAHQDLVQEVLGTRSR